MPRQFDRNMFIMLFSIMIGIVIITFFVADLTARSSTEEALNLRYTAEKKEIEQKNLNFTSAFLDSLSSLDLAREFKSDGDIEYQIAKSFYGIALSNKNSSNLEIYKTIIIDNCTIAMTNFIYSSLNFNNSIERFNIAKNNTNYPIYDTLVNLYINLSESGHRLTLLKYKAASYLKSIAEKLELVDGLLNTSMDLENLQDLLNSTEYLMSLEEAVYDGVRVDISNYELMEKIR